jgi:hypothetical protein
MRRCSTGHWARVEEFAANRARHDGISNYCRTCDARKHAVRYGKEKARKRWAMRPTITSGL